jgi:uncharacterized damage-inducible protein DinB
MTKTYRKGAIGALTDEYEKALNELTEVLNTLTDKTFSTPFPQVKNKYLQSVKLIIRHVVKFGYAYTDFIREKIGSPIPARRVTINNLEQASAQLNNMFLYTAETFKDKRLASRNALLNMIIETSWATYDAEALIEHAIVHVMRHRRQIEKLVGGK